MTIEADTLYWTPVDVTADNPWARSMRVEAKYRQSMPTEVSAIIWTCEVQHPDPGMPTRCGRMEQWLMVERPEVAETHTAPVRVAEHAYILNQYYRQGTILTDPEVIAEYRQLLLRSAYEAQGRRRDGDMRRLAAQVFREQEQETRTRIIPETRGMNIYVNAGIRHGNIIVTNGTKEGTVRIENVGKPPEKKRNFDL